MFVIIFQRLLLEAVLDVLYFPVWWYTRGLGHAGLWCFHLFQSGNASLGPGLWFKNIFTPMFGQSDWQGRIISFFMRSVNVIGRGIALMFWLVFCLILFVIWIILPLVMMYTIYLSIKS